MKNHLSLLCFLLLAACASPTPFTDCHDLVIPAKSSPADLKRSLVTEMSEIDDRVEDGSAYEKISLKRPSSIREIYVPKDVTVFRSNQSPFVTIFLKKELGYAGHPEKFTSIRTERKNMWAAIQIHSKALRIALKGGWGSMEGGSDINMVVFVPAGVNVKWATDLNFSSDWTRRDQPIYTASDWYVLPSVPDPAHLFDKYSPPAPNS